MRQSFDCNPNLGSGNNRAARRRSAGRAKAEYDVTPAFCEQTLKLGRATSLRSYALRITANNAETVPGVSGVPLPPGVIAVTYPDAFQVGPVVDAMSDGQTRAKLRLLERLAQRMSGRYPTSSEMDRILRLVDGLLIDWMFAHVDAARRQAA